MGPSLAKVTSDLITLSSDTYCTDPWSWPTTAFFFSLFDSFPLEKWLWIWTTRLFFSRLKENRRGMWAIVKSRFVPTASKRATYVTRASGWAKLKSFTPLRPSTPNSLVQVATLKRSRKNFFLQLQFKSHCCVPGFSSFVEKYGLF